MLLMYSLERMDILPVDDFGIREGYRILKSLSDAPRSRELRELGKALAPHRTVASWYLSRVPALSQVGPLTSSYMTIRTKLEQRAQARASLTKFEHCLIAAQ